MKLLHYQVFRCSGLCFPEQLQVIVTGDVLQQRLSGVGVRLPMLLRATRTGNREMKEHSSYAAERAQKQRDKVEHFRTECW